jgi:Arc/MetJ family transcription regulator
MKRTNVELDETLLVQAKELSKLSTTKEVLHQALSHYVLMLKRRDMLSLFGKVEWDGDLAQMRRGA